MAKEKDIKIIDGKICCTSQALYELLKINESTLVRWGQNKCPKICRGWWAIEDVLEWRGQTSESPSDEDIDKQPLSLQKLHYEVQWKKSQSEANELKNAISRGDYIPKEKITEELKRFFVVLKRSMTGYSRKIAIELSHFVEPSEARRMENNIKDLTCNVLEQISIDGVYDAKKSK